MQLAVKKSPQLIANCHKLPAMQMGKKASNNLAKTTRVKDKRTELTPFSLFLPLKPGRLPNIKKERSCTFLPSVCLKDK